MTGILADCLNRIVLVSVPSLFGDDKVQPYTLIDIEPSGLWLQSEALADGLLDGDKVQPSAPALTAFFPFSQMAKRVEEVDPCLKIFST